MNKFRVRFTLHLASSKDPVATVYSNMIETRTSKRPRLLHRQPIPVEWRATHKRIKHGCGSHGAGEPLSSSLLRLSGDEGRQIGPAAPRLAAGIAIAPPPLPAIPGASAIGSLPHAVVGTVSSTLELSNVPVSVPVVAAGAITQQPHANPSPNRTSIIPSNLLRCSSVSFSR